MYILFIIGAFELYDEGEELFDNFIGSSFVLFPCYFKDLPKRGKSSLLISMGSLFGLFSCCFKVFLRRRKSSLINICEVRLFFWQTRRVFSGDGEVLFDSLVKQNVIFFSYGR